MASQELALTERMRMLAEIMRRGLSPTYPARESWARQLDAMADEVDALTVGFNALYAERNLNASA